MKLKIISSILALATVFSSFFAFSNLVLAQDETPEKEANTEENQPMNSYELFWPLVPGKVEGDSFYFLKLVKERVRGWFVTGDSKKADYEILLGTKRMVEAEALIKDSKNELAEKTINRAESHYSKAYDHIKAADTKGKLESAKIQRDRLVNVKTLIDYLKTISPEEIQEDLESAKEQANIILSDYLP